jgi:hypothetical protein
MKLDFEWPRARYKLRAGCLVAVSEPKMIRPKAEALAQALKVLVVETRGNEQPFEEVALKMANLLGMLEGHSHPGETEDLHTWVNLKSRLRDIVLAKNWDSGEGIQTDMGYTSHIQSFELHLLPNRSGPPSLALRPRSLGAALEIFAAEKVAAGTEAIRCEHCNALFLRGGGRGSHQKKRGSRFCTPVCKSAYHNALNRA